MAMRSSVTCKTFCSSFQWKNKTGNLPNIPANSNLVFYVRLESISG